MSTCFCMDKFLLIFFNTSINFNLVQNRKCMRTTWKMTNIRMKNNINAYFCKRLCKIAINKDFRINHLGSVSMHKWIYNGARKNLTVFCFRHLPIQVFT